MHAARVDTLDCGQQTATIRDLSAALDLSNGNAVTKLNTEKCLSTEMCDGRAQISTFRPFTSSAIEGRRKRVPGFVAAGDGTLVYYFPFGRKSWNAPTFSERQKIQTVTVWKSYGLRIVECRRDYTR